MASTLASVSDAVVANEENQISQSPVVDIPVSSISPEDGLARKRDRDGHLELQRSIAQFGVLTPITVRPTAHGPNDYLLIKGQGRTLACRLLGITRIPAIVVDANYAEVEKVQQFLVENVARLKMTPIDRALLVHRARAAGEETADVAERFGITPSTVRRLYTQLEGASPSEVAALRAGQVNLARHASITRNVSQEDRPDVVAAIAGSSIRTKDLEILFVAIGWHGLSGMGEDSKSQRIALLAWACEVFDSLPQGTTDERLRQLASRFPLNFEIRPDRSRMSR